MKTVFDPETLRGALIVSCQPVDGGPMDAPETVRAMALAAEAGGAAGLRIEGFENLAAVRAKTRLPVFGIKKRDLPDSPVRITPYVDDVLRLAELGADIIAYDPTQRPRPETTKNLVQAVLNAGRTAAADCASFEDAERAAAEGAQIVGSTLSGYAYDTAPADAAPDFALVEKLAARFQGSGVLVMAEGRLNSPALARRAVEAGADIVTVGSAVTRVEHITGWFASAVRTGGGRA